MEIPKNLKDEIWEYCRLNDITDLNLFIINMLKQGYNVEKYGATPYTQIEPEIIEKEIIKEVEKIVEVPVEVVIEKEIIKEVEKIVEVMVTDDSQVKELLEKIQTLESKITDLNLEIRNNQEKIIQNSSSNDDTVEKLKQKISNLEIELELEKNRNYVQPKLEKPIDDKPQRTSLGNVISWVSKDERDSKDLYGE